MGGHSVVVYVEMLLAQDACKDSRFLGANPLKRPADWTPINPSGIDATRAPFPSTGIHGMFASQLSTLGSGPGMSDVDVR